jgi:eukaryotic-like serine/threonine-protein kinase
MGEPGPGRAAASHPVAGGALPAPEAPAEGEATSLSQRQPVPRPAPRSSPPGSAATPKRATPGASASGRAPARKTPAPSDSTGPRAKGTPPAARARPWAEVDAEQPDEPADDGQELGLGSVLDGKYRLVRELGEGGMGTVFVAHNEALDVEVAVKVIRAGLAGVEDQDLAARLLQEARAAARLGHPAILRVFDLGMSAQGHPYIVMELLEGEDLGTVIDRRGPLNPVRAVQTILPIAHALATAHERGIVHRDVKPGNIFLTKTEGGGIQPKLIDFGVAKLERKTNTRLTAVGALLGSPDYMSPEQARGEEVDHASDIWSLCVVLYEMLVGQAPFSASNYNSLMRTIIEDRHAPVVSQGVGDDELSAILDRGLAKFRRERWPSMRELGKALACWLLDRGFTEDVCDSSLGRVWLEERSTRPPGDVFDSLPPPTPSRPFTPMPPSGARITPWSTDTAPGVARPSCKPARDGAAQGARSDLLLEALRRATPLPSSDGSPGARATDPGSTGPRRPTSQPPVELAAAGAAVGSDGAAGPTPSTQPQAASVSRSRALPAAIAAAAVVVLGGVLWLALGGRSPTGTDGRLGAGAASTPSAVASGGGLAPSARGASSDPGAQEGAVGAEPDGGVPAASASARAAGTAEPTAASARPSAAIATSGRVPGTGKPRGPVPRPGATDLPELKTPTF